MYDILGERFGHLTVIQAPKGEIHATDTKWQCVCDCGQIVTRRYDTLKRQDRAHPRQCSKSTGPHLIADLSCHPHLTDQQIQWWRVPRKPGIPDPHPDSREANPLPPWKQALKGFLAMYPNYPGAILPYDPEKALQPRYGSVADQAAPLEHLKKTRRSDAKPRAPRKPHQKYSKGDRLHLSGHGHLEIYMDPEKAKLLYRNTTARAFIAICDCGRITQPRSAPQLKRTLTCGRPKLTIKQIHPIRNTTPADYALLDVLAHQQAHADGSTRLNQLSQQEHEQQEQRIKDIIAEMSGPLQALLHNGQYILRPYDLSPDHQQKVWTALSQALKNYQERVKDIPATQPSRFPSLALQWYDHTMYLRDETPTHPNPEEVRTRKYNKMLRDMYDQANQPMANGQPSLFPGTTYMPATATEDEQPDPTNHPPTVNHKWMKCVCPTCRANPYVNAESLPHWVDLRTIRDRRSGSTSHA